MSNKIDDEQAKKMTEETRELMDKSLQQLAEHKVWLKTRMHELMLGKMPCSHSTRCSSRSMRSYWRRCALSPTSCSW